MTTEDVHKEFAKFESHVVGFTKEFAEVRSELKKLKDDMESFKTVYAVKMRVAGSVPDTMTPFAQRLPPVQPGGIK